MKKQTALTVALALALGVGAQAVASAAPYTDVPSSAKQAVEKLYKDGLLDNNTKKFGPSDRVTRVEMAKLVAEAMTKLEKADAQQKAMIKKLAAEFKPELDALKADVDGVKGDINTINGRLDGVEKKLAEKQNIQFNGYMRERYESTDKLDTQNSDSKFRTRVRLDMTAPLDGNFTFHSRFEHNSSDTTNGTWENGSLNVAQAYIAGKAFGLDAVLAGRVPLYLGQGLVADITGDNLTNAPEAFAVATHIDKVNIVAGVGRVSLDNLPDAYAGLRGYQHSVTFANVAAPIANGLNMTASYLKDSKNNTANVEAYKTTAVGLNYTGFENLTVTGEWAKNNGEFVKTLNNNSAPKAYYYQVKFRGADKAKEGSFGIWAQYRNADNGFDALNLTTLDSTVAQQFGPANDAKGMEYGVEYTAFKNGMLTFKYEDLKQKSSDKSQKAFIGQLEVFF